MQALPHWVCESGPVVGTESSTLSAMDLVGSLLGWLEEVGRKSKQLSRLLVRFSRKLFTSGRQSGGQIIMEQ